MTEKKDKKKKQKIMVFEPSTSSVWVQAAVRWPIEDVNFVELKLNIYPVAFIIRLKQ